MKKQQTNRAKSILITGCSSGIGLCVAQGLQQRGHRVFASARQEADVERLRHEGLTAVQLDLDDSESIQTAVRTVLAQTDGRLDALFNNGAYGQPGAVEDLSRDALKAQFETNLFGWHELTCQVIPIMRAQGAGRIIQNSSVLGLVAMPYRGAYIASKFALEGLTDTLRLELHKSGIFISLIEPGPIESRFRENSFAMYQRWLEPEKSVHFKQYESMRKRLQTEGPAVPFTLPATAVLKPVIHALESSSPKARYAVTVPTHLFGILKRLLPAAWLDTVVRQII